MSRKERLKPAYQVQTESDGIIGGSFGVTKRNPAMNRSAAEAYIRQLVGELGYSPADIKMLPFAAQYVEGLNVRKLRKVK